MGLERAVRGVVCEVCDGTGVYVAYENERQCPICKGQGRVADPDLIDAMVKAGWNWKHVSWGPEFRRRAHLTLAALVDALGQPVEWYVPVLPPEE